MANCYNGLTFNFDGKTSDLFGLYMGWRNAEEEWNAGLDREIIKSETNMVRHIANQYGTKYTDTLVLEFDVFHKDGSPFTYRESRQINRWLMQDSYKNFMINDNNTENVYYKVICTSIQDISLQDFSGKHVVMQCDSPFAYTMPMIKTIDATTSLNEKLKINISTDDGDYYPLIKIETPSNYAGTIELINETLDKTMTINMQNISADTTRNKKILTLDCQHLYITDYNGDLVPLYKVGWTISSSGQWWFRFQQDINEIRLKGKAKFTFKMSFPRKAGQIDEQHLPL